MTHNELDRRLANYLRVHRRSAGLSQAELGSAVGYRNEGTVARHEWFHATPPLEIAISYEIIFRTPVANLFAGLHDATRARVEARLAQLETELGARSARDQNAQAVARKLMACRTEKSRVSPKNMRAKLRGAGQRILALDIRSGRIGYAAFETPARLIDFGVTRFNSRHVALLRLIRILQRTDPTLLALRRIRPGSSRNTARTRTLIRYAWLYARRSKIATAMIHEKRIRDHFSSQGATTKNKTALFLVQRFPELEWRLPLTFSL